MKKLIILTFILLAASQFAFSQQAIAKIKFEEAEEAYSVNDFEATISKLNEVESILKSTNPKVMYLKIIAQSKIVEKSPLKNYKTLESTRKLSVKYLKDYENAPNNEDKYREIYNITESLKKYPKSEADFVTVLDSLKNLGDSNYYGKGMAVNYPNALKYYSKMLDLGDNTSSVEIGNIYLIGVGIEKDYKKALNFYLTAAEINDKYAQNQLGYMYAFGYGVQANYIKAGEYFRLSANQDYAVAQYNLAVTSPLDYNKYLDLALEQNDAYAQRAKGSDYEFGRSGCKKDYKQAVEYYKLSADQGLYLGKFLLGSMYFEGKGVEKDKNKAALLGYSKTITIWDIMPKNKDYKHVVQQ
jgi:TPR repeat protein